MKTFLDKCAYRRHLVKLEFNRGTFLNNLDQVTAAHTGAVSIIGLLLYLSSDRLDIMFTVKELPAAMSKPTLCAPQRLGRLMGYLKFSGNSSIKLGGKRKEGCEMQWILETYTDTDWSSNRSHRKSTSCAVHFINAADFVSCLSLRKWCFRALGSQRCPGDPPEVSTVFQCG